ncbi:MAG: hypothetical protein ACJATT_000858 [Myxococcota bacterium]|jgi:hypothetical protein
MTSDPFQPPKASPTSSPTSLALLVQLGVVSILQSALLSCCCGLLGVLVAWVLPVVCIAWGAIVWQTPDSSEEERYQGRLGAMLGLAGLATIPLTFAIAVCIGIAFGSISALFSG